MTMDRDKQIEEMTSEFNAWCDGVSMDICATRECTRCCAEMLTEKGYRKASSVAREIIDIIEKRISINEERYESISNEMWQAICKAREHAYKDLKEIIEQKYTEEGK